MSVLALATTGPLPLDICWGLDRSHPGSAAGIVLPCAALAIFSAWSVWARVPEIDAMKLPPLPARPAAAIWEALTAASHRAQEVEPGVRKGARSRSKNEAQSPVGFRGNRTSSENRYNSTQQSHSSVASR